MSGNKFLLDTNAVIALLQGNQSLLSKIEHAEQISISAISVIEFLSFSALPENDKNLFKEFVEKVDVIAVPNNFELLKLIAAYKIQSGLKLPDAIIATTAIINNSVLVTNDNDFNKFKLLNTISF